MERTGRTADKMRAWPASSRRPSEQPHSRTWRSPGRPAAREPEHRGALPAASQRDAHLVEGIW